MLTTDQSNTKYKSLWLLSRTPGPHFWCTRHQDFKSEAKLKLRGQDRCVGCSWTTRSVADYYHCFVDSKQSDKQLKVCWTTRGLLWYVVNSEQSAGELVAPASAVSTVSDFLTQSATSPESRDSCWIMFSINPPLMVTYLCKSTQKYILLHCPAGPEFDLHVAPVGKLLFSRERSRHICKILIQRTSKC